MTANDPFNARSTLSAVGQDWSYCRLGALRDQGVGDIDKLPYSIRVLLEAMLRNLDGFTVTADDVSGLAGYDAQNVNRVEMPFSPGRVVLQDFTGVPCVVDLAAMRDAMKRLGGDPSRINPEVQCDLVIDHSVQVDDFATRVALTINAQKEFERNNERYRFLKWGQQSLSNFRVVPPATGIVHQVNLEYLARGVLTKDRDGVREVFPDSLVGTDSHTTMINGLGVVGWGVGGIEAEAVMLGQPVYMLTPEVIGFRLKGRLPEGATATDLVLTVTQMLRAHGVVEKFVEFFGDGLAELSIPDRATIANMAPEYGATMGFFPIDERTIEYLRFTGREEHEAELTEAYARANDLFWTKGSPEPIFTDILDLDLSAVQPSLAGPKRPQDRVALASMRPEWHKSLTDVFNKQVPSQAINLNRYAGEGGNHAAARVNPDAAEADDANVVVVELSEASHPSKAGMRVPLTHGSVVIAAITSCTNTSNPDVMLAAGLVARKARERGLTRKPWVKTSLAPGSKVVTEYYDKSGLTADLESLGFHTVGYGCTTCIGNSGPLPPEIEQGIKDGDLVAASVLSGNRNFEGRVHPAVKANYLASPPLVVAYAIAGTVDIDLMNDPIATDASGKAVFLKDIWPTHAEIAQLKAQCVSRDQFVERYADVFTGNETWNQVPVSESELYPWDGDSTYIQDPPFFEGMGEDPPGFKNIESARVLCMVGDSVTTDHISPAGRIEPETPAGQYLIGRGVEKRNFNSYGSRRGNDRVMTRGTFANVRVKNMLATENGKPREGGWTRDFTDAHLLKEGKGLLKYLEGAGGPQLVEHARDVLQDSSINLATIVQNAYQVDVLMGMNDAQLLKQLRRTDSVIGRLAQHAAAKPVYIFDAAMNYRDAGTPLVVLAGKDYGMGSSRDWAAKGTLLLGVRAVIAVSYERIHRSNLVFMGVLPLQFTGGQSAQSLGLRGDETFDIVLPDPLEPGAQIEVRATPTTGGEPIVFACKSRIDTPIEIEYYRNGGILQTVIRKKLNEARQAV